MVAYHQVYWPLFLFVTIVGCIGFTRVLIKQKLQLRLKKSGIEDILQMDGFQFEHYLATLFRGNGYTVKVTSSRGDFGADLLLNKDGKKDNFYGCSHYPRCTHTQKVGS